MKVVISEPKTGKSYQTEIDENKSKALYGTKIGKEIDGGLLGLVGFKVKITGGTDKEGFPMRPDMQGMDRRKVLLSTGPGLKKKKKGERRKKTVRGNIVSEEIQQVNVVVSQPGAKSVAETLGVQDKPKEEEKKGE